MDAIRDSGIFVDSGDNESSDRGSGSVVKKLTQQFEVLAQQQNRTDAWVRDENRTDLWMKEENRLDFGQNRPNSGSNHTDLVLKEENCSDFESREENRADLWPKNKNRPNSGPQEENRPEFYPNRPDLREEKAKSQPPIDVFDMRLWAPSLTPTSSRPASTHSNKLRNIVRELLDNEENYVRTLQTGIRNYLEPMQSPGTSLPRILQGQKYRIFGNIENICALHCDEFLPRLLECGEDVEQIADTFTSFIQSDTFYGYVLYAINSKRSEVICKRAIAHFQMIQEQCGDRLGLNSFLLQPIQRLPRYKLLLDEIVKELYSELPNTNAKLTAPMKSKIAAVCRAERSVQRLARTINEAISINDVQNCNEVNWAPFYCLKMKISVEFALG